MSDTENNYDEIDLTENINYHILSAFFESKKEKNITDVLYNIEKNTNSISKSLSEMCLLFNQIVKSIQDNENND